MKVVVDKDRCQGHALCAMRAPEVFGLRPEDGHAELLIEVVPRGQEPAVAAAVAGCPERAIRILADPDVDVKKLMEERTS